MSDTAEELERVKVAARATLLAHDAGIIQHGTQWALSRVLATLSAIATSAVQGDAVAQLIAERDHARALAVEACDIASNAFTNGAEECEMGDADRITEIRKAAVAPTAIVPSRAQLCSHESAYACHECEASRCVTCDVKVASRSAHVKLFRVCPRCL